MGAGSLLRNDKAHPQKQNIEESFLYASLVWQWMSGNRGFKSLNLTYPELIYLGVPCENSERLLRA